ncbi:uncharacterized protein ACA1_001310, partial [Acanthamoeba castellanii str. Neff]
MKHKLRGQFGLPLALEPMGLLLAPDPAGPFCSSPTCPTAISPPHFTAIACTSSFYAKHTSVLFCKWVNSTELACPQAPLTSPGAVSIVIKIGPNIISPANLTFLFYQPPQLQSLDPPSGRVAGGYDVRIWGYDFFPNPED